MKRQTFLKSTLCLLMALVCNVAWAETSTDGPIVTFTNVQKDGKTYTLYINADKVLAISTESAEALGDAAKFRATLQANGKYTFYNEANKLYMIWRGKGNGYNSDKGVLAEYNSTYCDWTMIASTNLSGGYYFYSKRGNGTSDGSLVILKAGTFDAYGNTEGWADGHTNVYKIESEEYVATLTDNQGAVLTCTAKGFIPSYAGASLGNQVWTDGNLAATINTTFSELPFPVSSIGEAAKLTMISSFKDGGGSYPGAGRFKWYAEGDDVKIQRDASTMTREHLWTIYPSLENGALVYSIKSVALGKYIQATKSFGANSGDNNEGTVILSDTPTKFSVDNNNSLYYYTNGRNHFLSWGSVNTASGYLGVHTKTVAAGHNGITNSFHESNYTLPDKGKFVNGDVYTFITSLGWMGATAESSNVISTARTNVEAEDKSADNPYFQWTVYKSNNGNYYLYNIGKEMFMGVQSTGNASVPFTENPAGKMLTFKEGNKAGYPILFSTDNKGSVNHSTNFGEGLITWSGGWNDLTDNGNSHQVTLVSQLPEATLQEIAAKVEAYDRRLYVTATVEGSWENNPNTHFGSVTATTSAGTTLKTTLKTNPSVATVDYNGLEETTIDFTREYRGFEFQGFFLGGDNLGKSFTLTEAQEANITEQNPLVAKFTATDEVTLFYDDDEFSYRIPAIATTSTGRLIAVSDYRYSLDDIGRYNFGTANPGIDLVMRYSDDNGKTWSETKTIAKGSCVRNTDDCAYGDAAIAVVGQKVLVMGAAGDVMFGNGSATSHNRTVRILSEDNGETWTKPLDISETFFINADATINSAYSLFFGSGKLAVDENYNGTGNARIYGAVLVKKNGIGNGIYVVYTDDFGLTWSILGGSQTHLASNDEPKVEILPSGQILLSIRRDGGRQFNVFTYTDKTTNAGSWNGNADGCSNGGSNTCNGEIFLIDAKKADGTAVKLLLQSQPKGGSGRYDRRDVTIWYKEVDNTSYTSSQIAGNWTQGMQVSIQQSAYSTMSLQKDGKIAFFFEEAPCYGDDQAKGYCMVYMPLTIEQITKNKYFSLNADLTTERNISVVLTDAQGNEYRQQVTSTLGGVATKLSADYPFITLGDNATLESADGESFTYTNTVTLPFKVSNESTTVWHNIYYPINTNENNYPVYMSAIENDAVVKISTGSAIYGDSEFNTQANSASISWAFYQEGTGLTFKLKNKLNGKYVKTTSEATGSNGGANVQYTENIAEAAAFVPSKEGHSSNYLGEYSLKVGDGFICVWTVSDGRVTYTTNKNHKGAWVKFVEAPDFETLFAEVNATLDMIGSGLGQYTVSETNATTAETAKEAMENSGTVKLNDLNIYKGLLTGATLNKPQVGQYFRIRGISGNYIDASSIYNNANATTGQMSMKSAKTCNYTGTIFLLDEGYKLKNYHTGTYIKETREIGADVNEAGVWTFAESPRKGGKYALSCTTTNNNGSHLHDNSGNRADRCSSNCGERHDFILEEIEPTTVTISNLGYSTLYSEVALSIPEGEVVTAYTGTLNETNEEITLTLNKVEGGTIPANTAVILNAEADTYSFNITAKVPAIKNNALRGTATEIETPEVTDSVVYTLQQKKVTDESGNETYLDEVVFGKYIGETLAAGKAYLVLPADENGEVTQSISIRFEGTTDIEHSTLNPQPSTQIYDLFGRRVEAMTKGGIYIVNGKKVVVK